MDVWNRLAALLPEAEAQAITDCWDIGEQEAGLGLLVSGILTHQMAISETERAQISVLAEDWGGREALAPRILQCRGDDRPTQLKLIENDGGSVSGATVETEQDLAGHTLVPWIACTRCGRVLMRAHAREPWGDLSYLALHYVIMSRDRATVLWQFPADSVDKALADLLHECSEPWTAAGSADLAS